jgi:hypothetical protein
LEVGKKYKVARLLNISGKREKSVERALKERKEQKSDPELKKYDNPKSPKRRKKTDAVIFLQQGITSEK